MFYHDRLEGLSEPELPGSSQLEREMEVGLYRPVSNRYQLPMFVPSKGRLGSDKLVHRSATRQAGWRVNSKRVERIWRQEGLMVPARQPKRGNLWLEGDSCIRLRPTHRNHVRAYDFLTDRTANGKAFRMLTVVNEYTRECLAVVERKLNSTHVLETLGELFIRRGPPQHICSDNGQEFCAEALKRWLKRLAVKTLFI